MKTQKSFLNLKLSLLVLSILVLQNQTQAATQKNNCQELLGLTVHQFVGQFITKNGRVPSVEELPENLRESYKQVLHPPSNSSREFDIDYLVDQTAAWIKSKGKTPSAQELAAFGQLNYDQLEKYLNKKSTPTIAGLVAMAKQKNPEIFKDFEKKYALAAGKFLKMNTRLPSEQEIAEELGVNIEELKDIYGSSKGPVHRIREYAPQLLETLNKKLIFAYAKAAKITGRVPTTEELAQQMQMDLASLQALIGPDGLFKDMAQLKEEAIKNKPSHFKDFLDTDFFNAQRLQKLVEAVETKSNLILTTAVAGHRVEPDAFKALLRLAREKDAEIIVYAANMQTTGLDPLLLTTPGVHILTHSVLVSPHLQFNSIKLLPKQIKPSTGLNRYFDREQIQLIGSPKLEVDSTATLHNDIYPTRTVTTGAITAPDYQGRQYREGRLDAFAKQGHVIGAVLLEKTYGSDHLLQMNPLGDFHIRHLEYIPEKKGFADLNKFYTATGPQKHKIKAVAFGDIHVGSTDANLLRSFQRQIFELKPDLVVLHDILDGYTVSHHDKDKVVLLAQKAKEGHLNVKEELDNVVYFINSLLAMDKNLDIVIVSSNHNDWLKRWLNRGEFAKDPINSVLGAELFSVMVNGKDPLRHYIETHVSTPRRIIFPNPQYGMKVGPQDKPDHLVEIGQHGHAGANGAKNSLLSFLRGVGRGVYGHSHTYARYNGAVNVGTSTYLRLPYNQEGFANWSQSLALIGENGEIQVLEFRENEWYRPLDKDTKFDSKDFFGDGFPKVIPNQPQIDKDVYQIGEDEE